MAVQEGIVPIGRRVITRHRVADAVTAIRNLGQQGGVWVPIGSAGARSGIKNAATRPGRGLTMQLLSRFGDHAPLIACAGEFVFARLAAAVAAGDGGGAV